MSQIVRKISNTHFLLGLPLLTIVSVAFLHFDHNYSLAGTVALISYLSIFRIYLNLENKIAKILFSVFAVVLLYLVAGAVALLFATTLIVYEVLKKPKESYFTVIALAVVIVMSLLSIHLGWIGEWNRAWTPAMYYSLQLAPPIFIYFPWLIILMAILIAGVGGKINVTKGLKKRVASIALQSAIVITSIIIMFPIYGESRSRQYKKLSYYARTQQWDKIIEESEVPFNNLLHIYYLNIALAEKGCLADRFFEFDQRGPQGLIVQWDRSLVSSLVMSDMQFALRNPAEAQRVSFEANIIIAPRGSAHLYEKLIQTNLVFGNYGVAEKYINLLDKTLFYKNRVLKYKHYLHNESAINNDPILGTMRKSIPQDDSLFGNSSLNLVLEILAETNPSYSVPIELWGLIYLSARDLTGFERLMNKYYKTDVLPQLPRSFQEAIFVVSEHDTQVWEKYDIPVDLAREFLNYRQFIKKNSAKPNLHQLVEENYGHTYWFYYMFKK